MILSNCAVCGKKKSAFIKNKEIKSILSAGDKYTPQLHLKQPGLLIVPVNHLPNIVKEFTKF